MERACSSCHEFNNIYCGMKRSIELLGKSLSTLTNYARCLATMALHLKGLHIAISPLLKVMQIISSP